MAEQARQLPPLTYSITGLTGDQCNLIAAALGEMPLKVSGPLFSIIQAQVKQQEATYAALQEAYAKGPVKAQEGPQGQQPAEPDNAILEKAHAEAEAAHAESMLQTLSGGSPTDGEA